MYPNQSSLQSTTSLLAAITMSAVHLDSMFAISISDSSMVQSTVDGDMETVLSLGYEEVSVVKLVMDFHPFGFFSCARAQLVNFYARAQVSLKLREHQGDVSHQII